MRKNSIIRAIALLIVVVSTVCCKDTWLMYDTGQKDKLYFTEKGYVEFDAYISKDASFALLGEQTKTIEMNIPISLLGQPTDYDRQFEVDAIHDTTTNFTSGNLPRELVDAINGEDYELSNLVIPAGKVTGVIKATLKRTDKISTKTASLLICVRETDQFKGMPRNFFRILISDGEPTCPSWWRYDKDNEWYQFLGLFTTEKYRKVLEFYHEIGKINPDLYAQMVEQAGENIDKPQVNESTGALEDLKMGFMVNKANPYKLAWVRYVLCTTFDYWKANYPDAEKYTTSSVNVTTKGWRDPAYNY